MYRLSNIVIFLVVSVGAVKAQNQGSDWSIMFGGQASYSFESKPVTNKMVGEDYRSNYSPAYGGGLLSTLRYQLNSRLSFMANIGADVQRFSYELVGPPSLGEINGRVVPGRNLTSYKGLAVAGFAAMGTEVKLGSSGWSPSLIFEAGSRYWIMEHSNAEAAILAGFQPLEDSKDVTYQAFGGLGFGVSPFSDNNRISLLFQRTLEPAAPLSQTLVLRQVFILSSNGRSIQCPTF